MFLDQLFANCSYRNHDVLTLSLLYNLPCEKASLSSAHFLWFRSAYFVSEWQSSEQITFSFNSLTTEIVEMYCKCLSNLWFCDNSGSFIHWQSHTIGMRSPPSH